MAWTSPLIGRKCWVDENFVILMLAEWVKVKGLGLWKQWERMRSLDADRKLNKNIPFIALLRTLELAFGGGAFLWSLAIDWPFFIPRETVSSPSCNVKLRLHILGWLITRRVHKKHREISVQSCCKHPPEVQWSNHEYNSKFFSRYSFTLPNFLACWYLTLKDNRERAKELFLMHAQLFSWCMAKFSARRLSLLNSTSWLTVSLSCFWTWSSPTGQVEK